VERVAEPKAAPPLTPPAIVQNDAPIAVTPPPNRAPERIIPDGRTDEAAANRASESRRERAAALAQDNERESPAPATRRKRRPAPQAAPAPAPRARAQAPAPAPPASDNTPEWLLSTEVAPPPPARQRHPQSTSMGTNNAPIFE
jgi:hypothetical protein